RRIRRLRLGRVAGKKGSPYILASFARASPREEAAARPSPSRCRGAMPVASNHASGKDLFAASLSHEMKTPLAALQAASRTLRKNLEGLVGGVARNDAPMSGGESLVSLMGSAIGVQPRESITGLPSRARLDAAAHRLSEAGVRDDPMVAAMA